MPFSLLYVARELRRRRLRTLLTALGLAAGVSLVVGIIGVSQGLDDAQSEVLSPLRSVGTDILVTRVVGAQQGSQPGSQATSGFFGGGANGQIAPGVDQADALALVSENASLVTDLSKLGKPGDHFTRDFFLPATLLSFPDTAVGTVGRLHGVAAAVGGLSLLATHQTGTVPQIVAEIQTGGDTVTQQVTPAPLTDSERASFLVCLQAHGGLARPTPGPAGAEQSGVAAGVIEACLPDRFRGFVAKFVTPLRTLRQVVDPPQTDITSTSYSAAGVDPSHPDEGLVTRAQVSSGRYLDPGATDQALLSAAYADRQKLSVGSTLTINGTALHVVGLVTPTLSGDTADVYLPLTTLQTLASKQGRVNTVLVKVSDAGSVDAVAREVEKALPGAQVVTTSSLAGQVTGSLSDARSLADRLGTALAVIVLAGAFLIAILLTLAGVGKRVREIGTLRAIGWPRGMVVRQVLAETAVIGVIGGVLGVGLGLAVDVVAGRLTPALTAGNAALLGQGSSSLSRFFGQAGQSAAASTAAAATRTVRITPPVHADVLLLGVGFAVLGGLLAGAVGGWRAARLQPADALRDLG